MQFANDYIKRRNTNIQSRNFNIPTKKNSKEAEKLQKKIAFDSIIIKIRAIDKGEHLLHRTFIVEINI